MKWGYKSKAWLLLFLTLAFVQWVYSVRSKLTYNGYYRNGIYHYDEGRLITSCFKNEVFNDKIAPESKPAPTPTRVQK